MIIKGHKLSGITEFAVVFSLNFLIFTLVKGLIDGFVEEIFYQIVLVTLTITIILLLLFPPKPVND